ncbi:MAG: aminomethyl transferase family protein [Methanobacteriota archaeon]|nr:MAG: aminomethyl transferase family protein [Euryarchaeota archaeon]
MHCLPMQELRLQPYHDLRGAIFRPEAGWSIPAGYSSLDAEVRAVRTRAGMIDLSDRAKIELTGSERVPFLDGLVTTDLKIIGPGMSTYALLLNEKSRVLGDLRVYAFADSLVLDIDPAQKDSILRLLEKARVSDDVEFRDLGLCGHIEVHGPSSEEPVAAVVGTDVRSLTDNAFLAFSVDRHHEGRAVRLRTFREDGYAIWSAGASLAELWEALVRRDVTPIGRDAAEVLRIEAGVPRFGADMGEDTLALEVAPESAISYTKGCYLGQEIVARGTYVGQVRRKLVGLRVEGDLPPVRGDRVSKGARDVGFVTSGAWSPTIGWVIAMALLRLDDVSAKDTLFINRGGWDLRARTVAVPFVRGTA